MNSNIEKFKKQLRDLLTLGYEMKNDLTYYHLEAEGKLSKKQADDWAKTKDSFSKNYQKWYSLSISLIQQLLPDRYQEFVDLYQPDSKRKEINGLTYKIQDWLIGRRSSFNKYNEEKYFEDFGLITMNFQTQIQILRTLEDRFETALFDVKSILQADMHDTELDAAKDLLKNGYGRAAGMLAGVTIEGHLKSICLQRKIKTTKKNLTISDLNNLLKKNGILDTPNWRFIQRLGDLRNLCGHKKERDPTKEEIQELINGADKVIKTVF